MALRYKVRRVLIRRAVRSLWPVDVLLSAGRPIKMSYITIKLYQPPKDDGESIMQPFYFFVPRGCLCGGATAAPKEESWVCANSVTQI